MQLEGMEDETDPEKLKQLLKERLKVERKKKMMEQEEHRKFILRKKIFDKEIATYGSIEEQIKKTTGFTAEVFKFTNILTDKEHFWGVEKLKQEWRDFHSKHLLEDVKGRSLGEDLARNMYLECFDQIMGSYQEIMLQMMNDFEFRRDRMLKDHWAFLKRASLTGMDLRDTVRTVSYATSDRYQRKCKLIYRRQRKNRNKKKDKRLDDFTEKCLNLETKAFNLWVQFRIVFGRFRKDWKIAKRVCFFMRLRDTMERREIAKQKKFLDEFDLMNKSNYTSSKSFWIEKNKDLIAERNELEQAFVKEKEFAKIRFGFDEKEILTLSEVSLGVIKELERIKEKLEKVLKIKQLCFKLETEEEKVFPCEHIEMCRPYMREEFHNAYCVDKLTYRTALVNSHCDHMEMALKKEAEANRFLKEMLREVLVQLRPERDVDLTIEAYNKDFS